MKTFPRRLILSVATIALIATALPLPAAAEIRWQRSTSAALERAQQSGRPILVFVTAQWCHYCEKMKRDTWENPAVCRPVGQHFETVVLDGDRDADIVSQMNLSGYPATLVYDPAGKLISHQDGYLPPEETLAWLAKLRRPASPFAGR